jgi:hypothetical protein
MSYIINKFDGTPLVVLQDGSIDTSTSVGLLGRNYVGYGETQNENFVHLLENFAGDAPPTKPIVGQAWFNKITNTLNVFTGDNWLPLNAAILSNEEPRATNGSFWFNTITNQLFIYENETWVLIGPEVAIGFGVTRCKSTTIIDSVGIIRPVIQTVVDNTILAIFSKNSFSIGLTNEIPGFFNIRAGVTLSSNYNITGSLIGNATTASRFEVGRTINGVLFDGSNDVIVKATTTNSLIPGLHIAGNQFDGSGIEEWSVSTASVNTPGKIVSRNFNGDFSANVITATLSGNVNGNVTTTTGTSTFNKVVASEFIGATLSGNALTATRLRTSRLINGVPFDGSSDITITASALSVTGTRLAPAVTDSNIKRLGIVESLRVTNDGIIIGNNNDMSLSASSLQGSVISVNSSKGFMLKIADDSQLNNSAEVSFISSAESANAGGSQEPAVVPKQTMAYNIGIPNKKFNKIYADKFIGEASEAENAKFSITQPAGTNDTTIATTAFVQTVMPRGAIVMWSGDLITIPNSWALCNGQNGTPDLREKFIVAAGGSYAIGAQGGANSVVLSMNQMPNHNHLGTSATSSVEHTHAWSGSGTTGNSGAHTHTINDPGHVHSRGRQPLGSADGSNPNLGNVTGNTGSSTTGISINAAENHAHSVSVSGTTAAASSTQHSHAFETNFVGNNSAIDIRPSYYALAYIMKL